MQNYNLLLMTDSYKHGHPSFINNGLEFSYSYGEARINSKYPETLMFGMNIILQKYFSRPITKDDLNEAIEFNVQTHGFNTLDVEVWEKVIDNGGSLPVKIKCAPEGLLIPSNNVLFTIESTEPWFAKSVQLLESMMMHVWYSCTTATRAYNNYKNIKKAYNLSGTLGNLPYALNDFGYRGATSHESAEIAGMSHLLFFDGSDNYSGSRGLKKYYNFEQCKGKSVMASEHSVALSYGRSGEKEYLKQMLLNTPDDQIVSIVIDTYDTYGFLRNYVNNPELKEAIIKREGRTMCRPDSGNPITTPINVITILEELFGSHINSKGFRVLNHNVGVIQGDGIDEDTIITIYEELHKRGYSADNLILGSGGGLHQRNIERDTQRFAIKPSFGIINGEPFNFEKNPTTDPSKKSKSGRLKLHPNGDSFITISSNECSKISFDSYIDVLETVYENGKITLTNEKRLMDNISKLL